MFRDCARLERNVFVTWKEDDVDEQDVGERKECWERKRVLSHIWVKSESDLDQISTKSLTSFNQSWYTCNTSVHSLQWMHLDFQSFFLRHFEDIESALKSLLFMNDLCSSLSLTSMSVLIDRWCW